MKGFGNNDPVRAAIEKHGDVKLFKRYEWPSYALGRIDLNSYKELKGELLQKYEALINKAEERVLNDSELNEEKQLSSDIQIINSRIAELEPIQRNQMKKAFENNDGLINIDADEELTEGLFENPKKVFEIKRSVPLKKNTPVSDFVLRNFDIPQEHQKVDVFSVLCCLMGKKYGNRVVNEVAESYRSALTGTALLNPFLSGQLIDGALSKSHLYNSGMKIFVAQEGEHKFARVVTFPTLEWKAALASTTERTVTFDSVTFDAKTLRGWLEISGELLMDALNIEGALRRVLVQAVGNQVDTAGLFGAGGADEPLGVRGYLGIPTYAHNNSLSDYDPFIQAQRLVWEENGPDLDTSIMAPSSRAQLWALKEQTTGNPIPPPWFMANHRFLETSKTPQTEGGGDESSIVMGGFESLNLGLRLQAQVMISPVIAETYSYKLLVVFRGDFQPDRVEDFALITGVGQGSFT